MRRVSCLYVRRRVLGFAEKIERAVREDAYKRRRRTIERGYQRVPFDFPCDVLPPLGRRVRFRDAERSHACVEEQSRPLLPTGFTVGHDNAMLEDHDLCKVSASFLESRRDWDGLKLARITKYFNKFSFK